MSWARQAFEEGMRLRSRLSILQLTQPCHCRRSATPTASLQRAASTSSSQAAADQIKPYYVTTPIFYVNADPHVGHLHSDIVADVLARWHQWRYRGASPLQMNNLPSERQRQQVVFSTGTDEHGLKIQRVAEGLKQHPLALCDRISKRFKVSHALHPSWFSS